MRRLLALLFTPLLLLAFAGCATVPAEADRARDDVVPGVALQEEGGAGVDELERESKSSGFGDYALVVPKNIVWFPWKILGASGKGLVDGISAGFEPNRLPFLGLLFMPVNAAVGLLTGFGTGIVSEPGVIGPRTNFGRTMGLPTQRPTPIWWLPELPPSGGARRES